MRLRLLRRFNAEYGYSEPLENFTQNEQQPLKERLVTGRERTAESQLQPSPIALLTAARYNPFDVCRSVPLSYHDREALDHGKLSFKWLGTHQLLSHSQVSQVKNVLTG